MRRLKQFDPLVIHDFEEKTFHMESHAHTYFEIGYIYKGTGIHYLNNSSINYTAGDLFLICPEDSHHFNIKTSTRFVFIKFTDSYFHLFESANVQAGVESEPTKIMRNRLLKETKLKITFPNTLILKNTIDNIVRYAATDLNISNSATIYHQILSIISLAKESIIHLDGSGEQINTNQEQLFSYIHDHIYEPSSLHIKSIAAEFNIAPNYFGAYFRRYFGMVYSEYVNNYKAKLIKLRIQSNQFTLRQISDEFGFTDESHLSRFFKKHYNISPGAYRKQ
ncbi:MAG: transcriptional regulator, AraC family [Pedobacter sp.]|jgi:AraC-like DNA-binding protein|nr:transcriptional regulator, AraC family [Pedobacter sp.]